MQQPDGSVDLDETTQTYLDTYIALEVLGMLYSEYIQRVPRLERLHNQFFLMLKGYKESKATERMKEQSEMEQATHAMMSGRG